MTKLIPSQPNNIEIDNKLEPRSCCKNSCTISMRSMTDQNKKFVNWLFLFIQKIMYLLKFSIKKPQNLMISLHRPRYSYPLQYNNLDTTFNSYLEFF